MQQQKKHEIIYFITYLLIERILQILYDSYVIAFSLTWAFCPVLNHEGIEFVRVLLHHFIQIISFPETCLRDPVLL